MYGSIAVCVPTVEKLWTRAAQTIDWAWDLDMGRNARIDVGQRDRHLP